MPRGLLLGISHILTNAPYFVLACALFRSGRRYSAKATIFAFAAFVFAHGMSDLPLTAFGSNGGFWTGAQFTLFCLGSIALLLLMFRITVAKALYAFLMIRTVYTTILYIVLNAFMLARPDDYIGFDATPMFTLAALAATGAVFPLLWRYTTGILRSAFAELDAKAIRQLCIPPVLFFMLDQCYSNIRNTLQYDSFQTAAIFALMLGTGLVTYYVNLRMMMDNRNRSRLESEFDKQPALQAQNYENLTRSIEEARAARHDLRHHLSVVLSFINDDDKAGLEKYLSEYTNSLPDEAVSQICQNYTVDAVAQHYLAAARRAGAELDVEIRLPREVGIPNSDLCIVFGNIFENAAQSCIRQTSGERFIRARCDMQNGHIVLAVDNSGDEMPSDTKHSRTNSEGIGLRSARMVAESHGGTLKFGCDDGVYQTSVIMMVR